MPEHDAPPYRIEAGTTLAAVLRKPPIDAIDARILVCHGLKLSRVQLITQSEHALDTKQAQLLSDLFIRRLAGEPVAYIIGEREFFGLALYTTPDVLIPRPETELLVELALERLPQRGRVLDMGTGTGAIAIAIAHTRPDAAVTAIDASGAALQVAQRNATQHGVHVQFMESDWYAALDGQHFDLIVSNPPYIVANDPHLSQGDLRFEPIDALTDHADGLSALRTIVHGAATHLMPAGWLLMEHGYDQAEAVRGLLQRNFDAVQSWKDLAGIERVSGGMVRGSSS
ncbi:peptide chain release factor N(5)-glutamine methyltransferase [Noviherbaspirillum sp. Root189]|uniref:peptide chain release factor N(5)-glutamine methyltransferase n=1 Tax=Noviherbaspirillum sp. Root189 TaxID=1736487 RepID=UPI0007098662|nr:peptide chain release factor N(5)-glutamine methyltransferase [Noviherbaspirillum sp. Root189]KRB92763.1 protein-(glutamine-N5) methyltransferase, release factor-specific [Noviherbaspirillum sp. Root189]